MKNLIPKSLIATAIFVGFLSACKKDGTNEQSQAPFDASKAQSDAVAPNVGSIVLEKGVIYYPGSQGPSPLNSQTVLLDPTNDNEAYATMLTPDQKAGLGESLQLNVNVYAQKAPTEPTGFIYFFKTPKGDNAANINVENLRSIYYSRRVEMSKYILPYLTLGVGNVTSSSPSVNYTFDISPFAAELKDPDSTVWIVSYMGGSNTNGPWFKLDVTLNSSGNTDLASFKNNFSRQLYYTYNVPSLRKGVTGPVLEQAFSLSNDVDNAALRVIVTGPDEGSFYDKLVLYIDDKQVDTYSTQTICEPDDLYKMRNPSALPQLLPNSLWRYPSRNYCQASEVPPHTTMLTGRLAKGVHKLKVDISKARQWNGVSVVPIQSSKGVYSVNLYGKQIK